MLFQIGVLFLCKTFCNMKHIFILLMALSMMPSISRGDSLASQMDIYLHFDRTFTELGGVVRTPPAPISVTQSDHVFTFEEYLAGETIEVVSDDTIVYTSIIGEDGTVVVPDDLTGDFTLVLYVGDKMYSAEVEL